MLFYMCDSDYYFKFIYILNDISLSITHLFCNTYNINDYVIKVIIKMNNKSNCSGQALTMAYVPWQKWQNLYNRQAALKNGTLFEELNKPFKGGQKR